jgi:hypothetical protein
MVSSKGKGKGRCKGFRFIYLDRNIILLKERMRAGGMAPAIEHLPRKYEALSSNPNTTKKKKKKKERVK